LLIHRSIRISAQFVISYRREYMPSQDEIMQQILGLVSQGAAMPLTAELESTLHDRYYQWIVTTKTGNTTSPQQIWDQDAGKDIQEKFVLIGSELSVLKLSKPVVNGKDCTDTCSGVESESKCPHCPDPSF
jgi:hypothetical protein